MHDAYRPLACDLYDYLEIACMHRYRLRIELVDGSELQARALTTRSVVGQGEFFVVENEHGEQQLRLDHLLAVTPLDPRASFGRVLLGNPACR